MQTTKSNHVQYRKCEHFERKRFLRMLCPLGLNLAKPYLAEERQSLLALMEKEHLYSNSLFIAIGAGPLIHLDVAISYNQTYVGIDPLINEFINKLVKIPANGITIINKTLEEVNKCELPLGRQLFVFLFNVISYINDVAEHVNRLVRPGDFVFFSTWSKTKESNKNKHDYFQHVNCEKLPFSEKRNFMVSIIDADALISRIEGVKQVEREKKQIMTNYILRF